MKHEVTFHYDKWERRHFYSPDDGVTVYTISSDYIDKGWVTTILLLSKDDVTYVSRELAWFDGLNKAKNFVRLLVHAKNEKRRTYNTAFVVNGIRAYGTYVRFD